MQVVVGFAEAWQLPLDVVALEWKAELWSAGRSASRLGNAPAGIRLAAESFTLSEGTVGWCSFPSVSSKQAAIRGLDEDGSWGLMILDDLSFFPLVRNPYLVVR